MSAPKHPGRQFGNIYIYIDNSNLWIQGQKTYAEKKGLDVSWDPTWRFDVGRLRDILLSNSDLKADEKTFDVKVNLYGSTPPPVDTVWKAIASHDVNVNTFERSSWTKREKQVDAELIADSIDQASEAYHRQIPTVFIIVSGDRDVRSAVVRITSKYRCQVHLWSWANGLARVYTHENGDIDKKLFEVHFLDDHLEKVGFHANIFRVDRAVISPHSIVVLDPLPKADKVEEFLQRLRTPVYRYEILPKRADASSQDLAIIPAFAWSMKSDVLRNLFMECKSKLEAKSLNVLSYMEYSQKYSRGTGEDNSLAISNRFDELPPDEEDDDEEEERPSEPEEDDKNQESDDGDGFIEVNRGFGKQRKRLKKIEEDSRLRCHWRRYCSRGLDCKYGHTKDEEEHFRVYGSQKPKKYQYCYREDCIRGKGCFFAHDMEELFCPTCGKTGVHEMHECPERFPSARRNYLD
ncbi:hypothetical protein NEMBOFW57_003979 [Staphylotrichum longicolle]|uniref:NYN domain-containing protein n=1 Tax=Staphylotrichum longicolle TaxID=669026 RepID=A0AAD4F731_9PEZI|nr:hypothetical protein NEMBOFW57_003979 [Staphylotrichum longicolle]